MSNYEIISEDEFENGLSKLIYFPISHIWGLNYKQLHQDVSFREKRKIVNLMYKKKGMEREAIYAMSRQIRTSMFKNSREINLQYVQKVIDFQLISSLEKIHNQVKWQATFFGAFLGSVVLPTIFRPINILNKSILSVCFCLISRKVADKQFVHKAFDELYDIYQMDLSLMEQKRIDEDNKIKKYGFDV